LKDGSSVTIRPIRPEDEPLLVRFHGTLSEESVYHRYFTQIKLDQRIAHERLTRICFNDYDREIALVVERKDPATGLQDVLAVGRLSKAHGLNEGEFAMIVSDRWQRQGLGTELLKRLVQIGREEKLTRISAVMMADNRAMQHVTRKAGFKLEHDAENRDFIAEYLL
jgi:acetyltransferase